MYTQCPQCGSVFRVTAGTLRIAAGVVRCGVCSREFDALAALTDEPGMPQESSAARDPAPPPAEYPSEDTITVEELGTGEVIEISTASDEAMIGESESAAAVPEETVTAEADEADEADDAIDVNESSVVGLEAITLSSEDEEPPTGAEPSHPAAGALEDGQVREDEAAAPAPISAPQAAPGTAEPPSHDEPPTAGADAIVVETADAMEPAFPPPLTGAEATEASAEALEFSGSEEDLERVFVATRPPLVPVRLHSLIENQPIAASEDLAIAQVVDVAAAEDDSAEVTSAAGGGAGDVDEPDVTFEPAALISTEAPTEAPEGSSRYADLDATDEYPILVLDESDVPDEATARRFLLEPDASPAGATTSGTEGSVTPEIPAQETPHIPIPDAFRRDAAVRSGPGEELAAAAFTLDSPRWWERRRVWIAASVLSALALAGQAIHYNRETLARSEVLGPWVLGTYALLGLEPPTPTDLGAIELRQWGASTDARMPGRLRLRASLLNRAPFAQPYPVLRLTLNDRFGNRIGSRDIGARDYLPGGATGHRLFTAGQRLDAEIVVVDPGKDAVGYEINLCREDREGVRCLDATSPPA